MSTTAPPVHERSPATTAAPRWLTRGSVPCLDGLRAVSILLVLTAHSKPAGDPSLPTVLQTALSQGAVGVDVFFVISGFLITLLLLREDRDFGAISPANFYRRRALRILPAYAVYLLTLAVLARIGTIHLGRADWVGALTYTVNFMRHPSWDIGHIWSLSLEEHFYLVWPLVFWLGPRWARRLAWGCLLLMPVVRITLWECCRGAVPIDTATCTRMDGIAAGCVLAFLAWEPRCRARITLAGRTAGWVGAAALAALAASLTLSEVSYRFRLLFGFSLDALAISALIWVCITHDGGGVGKLLRSRPLVWLGRVSYGVYIWQQLFLNPDGEGWMYWWPASLGFALLAAMASYWLVERPFLRLKASFRPAAWRGRVGDGLLPTALGEG
ncbi:MAG TPA: acyltransferase [Gemmataceae bacterium]|nr:acyltransferase [Gemmataceae bacterium]